MQSVKCKLQNEVWTRGAVTILAAAVLLGSAAWAQWPPGMPERLRQLQDLKRVVGPESRLSPEQRTLVLLGWLARERRQPSPSTKGLGGFPITSGYIQAQILQVLAGTADPVLIETLAGSPQVRDAGIRDAMRLSLGLMRDARQIPALTSILWKHPEPYFRWRAAQALIHEAYGLPVCSASTLIGTSRSLCGAFSTISRLSYSRQPT